MPRKKNPGKKPVPLPQSGPGPQAGSADPSLEDSTNASSLSSTVPDVALYDPLAQYPRKGDPDFTFDWDPPRSFY